MSESNETDSLTDVQLSKDSPGPAIEANTDNVEQEGLKESVEPPRKQLAGQKFKLSDSSVEVYVTQPLGNNTTTHPTKILILLTNSLGLDSLNNLRLADAYAETSNCLVVVPDLFDKDPVRTTFNDVVGNIEEQPQFEFSLRNVKALAASAIKGFMDDIWIAKHTKNRILPTLLATVSEIIQIYSPSSVGIVGYSFGARYAMLLLKDHRDNAWSSDEDFITTAVVIHPSFVELEDFESVGKPIFLVYSSDDEVLPEQTVNKGLSKLQDRHVEFDKARFSSGSKEPLPHGFAVPGDYPENIVEDKPQAVINLACTWLQDHM